MDGAPCFTDIKHKAVELVAIEDWISATGFDIELVEYHTATMFVFRDAIELKLFTMYFQIE